MSVVLWLLGPLACADKAPDAALDSILEDSEPQDSPADSEPPGDSPSDSDPPETELLCAFEPADLDLAETVQCSFTTAVAGRLRLAMENPDGSVDGDFFVVDASRGRLPRLWGCSGPSDFYIPSCTVGVQSVELLVPTEAGESYELQFAYSPSGVEDEGDNRLLVELEPGRGLEQGQGKLLMELSVEGAEFGEPLEQQVDLGEDAGLLLEAVSTGTGGGAHLLYGDGLHLLSVRTGDTPLWAPVVLRLPPGARTLGLAVSDDTANDNLGTRHLRVWAWQD